MSEPVKKRNWTEEIVSVVCLAILGLFGLHEQRTEGSFRIFMLPGWPTYAVMWVGTIAAIVMKARQRDSAQP